MPLPTKGLNTGCVNARSSNTRHFNTRRFNTKGFTFLELLCVLCIVAIFSAIAIPSYQHIYSSGQANTTMGTISSLIRLARNYAVTQRVTTTLCPSTDGETCGSDWTKGILLFEDEDNNSQLDKQDRQIFFRSPFLKQGSLQWNALRNNVQFSFRGLPRGSIGSFIYCPENGDDSYGRVLILSFQGKLRAGKDSDKDGIIESGSNRNISCS